MIYLIGQPHQLAAQRAWQPLPFSPSKERIRGILGGDEAHQLAVDQTEHRLGLAVSDPALDVRLDHRIAAIDGCIMLRPPRLACRTNVPDRIAGRPTMTMPTEIPIALEERRLAPPGSL